MEGRPPAMKGSCEQVRRPSLHLRLQDAVCCGDIGPTYGGSRRGRVGLCRLDEAGLG
jgi:hypothetical protein